MRHEQRLDGAEVSRHGMGTRGWEPGARGLVAARCAGGQRSRHPPAPEGHARTEHRREGRHDDELGLRADAATGHEHAAAMQQFDQPGHRAAPGVASRDVTQHLGHGCGRVHRGQQREGSHSIRGQRFEHGPAHPVGGRGPGSGQRPLEVDVRVARQGVGRETDEHRPPGGELDHPKGNLRVGDPARGGHPTRHCIRREGEVARVALTHLACEGGPDLRRQRRAGGHGHSDTSPAREIPHQPLEVHRRDIMRVVDADPGHAARHPAREECGCRYHQSSRRTLRGQQRRLALAREGGDEQARRRLVRRSGHDGRRRPKGAVIRTRRHRWALRPAPKGPPELCPLLGEQLSRPPDEGRCG